MKYLSVCSGIEAATVAWHPLGWEPFAFAEIEKFPSAVLAHHYPHVPNLGDMTKFKDWRPNAAIDVLVGGTPCQSFSVAGLRKGLADPRGNLALVYLAIADSYRPEWIVWENVPGVLSSNGGRDFGAIIGGMVELGYCPSWRVLDAQYVRVDGFGRAVPQRRRRVFIVGHLGSYRRSAAVLFERESLQGDTPPRRQSGQGLAADVAPSIISSGRGVERTGETRGQDPVIAVAPTLDAVHNRKWGSNQWVNNGFAVVEPISFSAKDHGADAEVNLAPTLRAGGFTTSHANAGVMPAIAFDTTQITSKANRSHPQPGDPCHPLAAGAHAPALAMGVTIHGTDKTARAASYTDVAGALRARTPGSQENSSTTAVQQDWAVRRLTPRECERLQGFPDDYTLIPVRGKPAADGPRYKALGNSMAVNCMRWIGKRIVATSALSSEDR